MTPRAMLVEQLVESYGIGAVAQMLDDAENGAPMRDDPAGVPRRIARRAIPLLGELRVSWRQSIYSQYTSRPP